MRFFEPIVGLRLYLALWVAVGHGLQLAGLQRESNAFTRLLINGHSAVVVFMIVSGFVITNLIVTRNELFLPYAIRRFFRLYPAYIIACIAGYSLIDNWVSIVESVPWQSAPGWQDYVQSIRDLDAAVSNLFWPHFGLHALMLHGIVPAQILDRASMTFVPAAWSISLEWQFYLLAPAILFLARVRHGAVAVASVLLIGFLAARTGLLGEYQTDSLILLVFQNFLVGSASYFAFDRLRQWDISPVSASIAAIFVSLTLLQDSLPMAVWLGFFVNMVWERPGTWVSRVFSILTRSRPVLIAGEASYSLYLVHRPIQIFLAGLLLSLQAPTRASMVAVQLAAIGVAVPTSIAMYFWIERPGMAIGRSLANRVARRSRGAVATRPAG